VRIIKNTNTLCGRIVVGTGLVMLVSEVSGVPWNFFRGGVSTNSVEDR
jgi:hypothetical protein